MVCQTFSESFPYMIIEACVTNMSQELLALLNNWRKWALERWIKLSKITQLISGRHCFYSYPVGHKATIPNCLLENKTLLHVWYPLISRKMYHPKCYSPVFSENKARNPLFFIYLKSERPTSIYAFSSALHKYVQDLVNKYWLSS